MVVVHIHPIVYTAERRSMRHDRTAVQTRNKLLTQALMMRLDEESTFGSWHVQAFFACAFMFVSAGASVGSSDRSLCWFAASVV